MNEGRLRLVQLTDTHLVTEDALLHGRLDTWARTVAAFSAAAHFAPDAVLVTGDIADRGQAIHSSAAKLFAKAQRELQCPIITLPGNHDPLGAVGTEFNASRRGTGPYPADTIHEVAGLRIIALDSHGFGEGAGWLGPEQLQWLTEVLRTPAPRGSIVTLHHPPIPSMHRVHDGRGLKHPEHLSAALEGSDVLGIFCGHYHLPTLGTLGSIPVWTAPAVSYNHNLFAPESVLQAVDTSWLSVITIEGAQISATPVQISAPPAVFTHEVQQLVHEPALA